MTYHFQENKAKSHCLIGTTARQEDRFRAAPPIAPPVAPRPPSRVVSGAVPSCCPSWGTSCGAAPRKPPGAVSKDTYPPLCTHHTCTHTYTPSPARHPVERFLQHGSRMHSFSPPRPPVQVALQHVPLPLPPPHPSPPRPPVQGALQYGSQVGDVGRAPCSLPHALAPLQPLLLRQRPAKGAARVAQQPPHQRVQLRLLATHEQSTGKKGKEN